VAIQTGAQLVAGSSLKASLDLNWDDPTKREQALLLILNTLDTVESWLQKKTHSNGKAVQFPKDACAICPMRSRCTTNQRGRSVSIHPDEALMHLMQELLYSSVHSYWAAKVTTACSSRTYFSSHRLLARRPSSLYWLAQEPV